MYLLSIYKRTIILSLIKIDALNSTIYILTILTCTLKTYIIKLHNPFLMSVFLRDCKEKAENK